MKILGIDPGIRGGLAIIEIIDGTAPQLITVSDIPVTGVGAKERVDVLAIRTWILAHHPQHALIERVAGDAQAGGEQWFQIWSRGGCPRGRTRML